MGNRVKRIQTAVSESQMAQAIMESWKEMFGTIPTKEQVGLIMAQNALETGHRKSMWNFNVGNITTDGKGAFDYYDDLTTSEQVNPGEWKKMNLKYRSYPTLKDGVKDYLKLLSGKRYSNAWKNIINPNPIAFSKSLKDAGYYTGNEAPYTKALSGLYTQFSKSDSYEKVKSNKVKPPPSQDIFKKYVDSLKDGEKDSFVSMKNKPVSQTPANMNQIDKLLDNYLQLISAANKNLYKTLSQHNVLIKINGNTLTNKIEFGNILSNGLEEELLSKAFVHIDENNVEVECCINGPEEECFNSIKEITSSIVEAFELATKKIGGIKIQTELIANKKSSYQPIRLKVADTHHRKFLLKFI